MADYNEMHIMFLQSMMSRAIIKKATAVRILQDISKLLGYETRVKAGDVTETIGEINAKINNFGQEIKEIRAENDSEEFVVLVNLVDDSSVLDRIDHNYTVKEREFFRVLLEEIVTGEPYGTISTMNALHLDLKQNHMRPGEIQDTIEKLVSDQWFIETNHGQLVPAPRCIAEFDLYMQKNYKDDLEFCVCRNIVFFGVRCPQCDKISHKYCFGKFNNKKDPKDLKCPACKKAIVDNTTQPNGEDRTPETPLNTPANRRERPGPSQAMDETPVVKGRRKRRSADDH